MLGVRNKSANLHAGRSPGSPKCLAQIDRDRARRGTCATPTALLEPCWNNTAATGAVTGGASRKASSTGEAADSVLPPVLAGQTSRFEGLFSHLQRGGSVGAATESDSVHPQFRGRFGPATTTFFDQSCKCHVICNAHKQREASRLPSASPGVIRPVERHGHTYISRLQQKPARQPPLDRSRPGEKHQQNSDRKRHAK